MRTPGTRARPSSAAPTTAMTTLVARSEATGPAAPRAAAWRRPSDARVGHRRDDEHEREVRDRRRVLEPVVVDERVARDAGADGQRERQVRSPAPGEAAHEHDAGGDREHAGRLQAA